MTCLTQFVRCACRLHTCLLAGCAPFVPWGVSYSLPCHCPNRSGHLQGVQCALQSVPQREYPIPELPDIVSYIPLSSIDKADRSQLLFGQLEQ